MCSRACSGPFCCIPTHLAPVPHLTAGDNFSVRRKGIPDLSTMPSNRGTTKAAAR